MNEREEVAARPVSAPASGVALSLVIPCFNEGQRLEDGVARLRVAIEAGAIVPSTTEFVVVDDGSADDTSAVATALFSRFPHVRSVRLPSNLGKGGAVRAGVAVASGPLIAFADADMAIDPGQTAQFVDSLARADVAIGSRAAAGASVDRASLRRSLMNRTFNGLVNILTGVGLADTQCGFKAFRAPAAKLLFHCSVTERFAFDVEILSLARKFGLVITEVPVQWLRVPGSQIRPWTDARSMVGDVYRAGRSATSGRPVPGLEVPGPSLSGAAAAPIWRSGLPPGLPVLPAHDGSTLVLCPLMSDAEIEGTAAQIAQGLDGATPRRTSVTVAELFHMAPLSLGGAVGTMAR
jgi:dolichyl-phosphate beta-glucosyltransferase